MLKRVHIFHRKITALLLTIITVLLTITVAIGYKRMHFKDKFKEKYLFKAPTSTLCYI